MDFRKTVITALILGGAAAAFSAINDARAEDKPLADRYSKLIRRQLKMVSIQAKHEALNKGDYLYRSEGYMKDMTKQFSKLLLLLDRDFNGAAELERNYGGLLVKVRKIFHGKLVIDTFDEEDLAAWENTVITIAVMRHMLATRRMIFDTRNTKGWDEFVKIYKDVVIDA